MIRVVRRVATSRRYNNEGMPSPIGDYMGRESTSPIGDYSNRKRQSPISDFVSKGR